MLNRFAAVIAASALSVGGAVVMASPASADTPTCVSKSEYRNVKNGFAKTRVHRMFDVSGKQEMTYNVGGDHYESRSYRPCSDPRWGTVWIDYRNGKVTSKMAMW